MTDDAYPGIDHSSCVILFQTCFWWGNRIWPAAILSSSLIIVFLKKFYFIEVSLIYNVLLISAYSKEVYLSNRLLFCAW